MARPASAACRYEIVEREARIDQASCGGCIRHKALYRRVLVLSGEVLEEGVLFASDTIMM